MLDGMSVEGWLVLLLLQSRLGLRKFELMRELAEVNCWSACFLKCWSVLICCYNRELAHCRSHKKEVEVSEGIG